MVASVTERKREYCRLWHARNRARVQAYRREHRARRNENRRKWYAKNLTIARAAGRRRYARASEVWRARSRRNYLKNRSARIDYARRYAKAHPEQRRKALKAYQARNREKIRVYLAVRYRNESAAILEAMAQRRFEREMARAQARGFRVDVRRALYNWHAFQLTGRKVLRGL